MEGAFLLWLSPVSVEKELSVKAHTSSEMVLHTQILGQQTCAEEPQGSPGLSVTLKMKSFPVN